MKDQKNKSWEFHGFTSNPEKSFEAGKKGSRLAVEASLRKIENTPQSSSPQAKTTAKSSSQSKSSQGKSWQDSAAKSSKASKKDQKSSSEE